jgi:transcriptional/translational regulatory protein YebC/TACO1
MLTSAPTDLAGLRSALEAAAIAVDSADIEMVPTTRVEVSDDSTAKRVLKLIELLEEHDDVQAVWANFDIPDEILEHVEL